MLITDERQLDSRSYNAVVVGSGPVGLTVALELQKAGRRTLVIETADGGADCAPSIGYGHYAGRYWHRHSIRAIGGTSAVWSGWCTTLREIDFDNPAVGVRWPLTRSELVPYYREAATIIDRDPAIVDYEEPAFPPWIYRPFSVDRSTRFAQKYGDTLKSSAHVDVATGFTVVGIDASASRDLVTGVHVFEHRSGATRIQPVRPDQSLVVACGGIGNAQLLLQPPAGGGPPVGNESGLVGSFLMEHPHFYDGGTCVMSDVKAYRVPASFGEAMPTFVLSQERMRELELHGCSLQLSGPEVDSPMRDFLAPAVRRSLSSYPIVVRSEMLPTAKNRVVLTAARDRTGLRQAAAHCVVSARDFLNVELTLRELGRTLMAGGLGRVRVDNDRIYRRVRGGGHIMGTTRMGTSRATSVVDRDCRVHGYDNFFVAGCSVFPTGGYANPTFTAVALACRLARTIGRT
jgi:choline dehydrogenase-like flavoprotein